MLSWEIFSDDYTLSGFWYQTLSIYQDLRNIGDLKALIVVLITLELELDQDKLRILYQNLTSLFDFMGDSFWRVVDWCHTEVMLVINQEEAHWYITLLIQRMNDLCTYHQSWVFTNLKLRNVNDLVGWFVLAFFFDESSWQNLWDGLNHVDDAVCLQSALVGNSVVCSWHKSYNIVAFFISLQIWIDGMCLLEISNSFVISLKIFQNGTSVKIQIWIWLLQCLLSLSISFKCMLQLDCALIVNEEIGEMGISQSIPTIRTAHVLSNSLCSKLNAKFVILFPFFSVKSFSIWLILELS